MTFPNSRCERRHHPGAQGEVLLGAPARKAKRMAVSISCHVGRMSMAGTLPHTSDSPALRDAPAKGRTPAIAASEAVQQDEPRHGRDLCHDNLVALGVEPVQ